MAKLNTLSYGSTAAIVTSMGLVAGLGAAAHPRATIISGLLLVAIADNLSDSLAIHIYQESEKIEQKQAFRATLFNFFTRFLVSISFVLLALWVPLGILAPITVLWGSLLLGTLTYFVARNRGVAPFSEVVKHMIVAAVVIVVSKAVGMLIVTHVT